MLDLRRKRYQKENWSIGFKYCNVHGLHGNGSTVAQTGGFAGLKFSKVFTVHSDNQQITEILNH